MSEFISNEILNQLGGNRFLAMVGAKYVNRLENGIQIGLPRNGSQANRLTITLNDLDLYDMKFEKYLPIRLTKNYELKPESLKEIKTFNDIYFDQLTELFEQTTKMYTRLF